MRLPSPDLSPDERALLECLAKYESAFPAYSLPLASARTECGLDAMHVRTVVWGLRDPRRFTADLAFLDERYNPPLLRLTPDGLEALPKPIGKGKVPNEPKLLAALASGVRPKADPKAVDQLDLGGAPTQTQRAA